MTRTKKAARKSTSKPALRNNAAAAFSHKIKERANEAKKLNAQAKQLNKKAMETAKDAKKLTKKNKKLCRELGKSQAGFPFMKLPLEIRFMIYKYTANYNSIHAIVRKLQALRLNIDWRNFGTYHTVRDAALRRINFMTISYIDKYSLHRPSILLDSKPSELHKTPLIISKEMVQASGIFHLRLTDFIPLRTLKRVKHLRFDSLQGPAEEAFKILWARVINEDLCHKTHNGLLLLEAEEADEEEKAKFGLRRVSFECLLDQPMMLDLTEELMKGKLIELFQHNFNHRKLKTFVAEYGKLCTSYDDIAISRRGKATEVVVNGDVEAGECDSDGGEFELFTDDDSEDESDDDELSESEL